MAAKKDKGASRFRDRIKEFRRVKASDIKANPKNWRLHPDSQKGALTAVLEQIGFVGAILAREKPDGTMEILDGHLRHDLAGDDEVPVLITDLNDDEADKILATFDPISGMALVDDKALGALLSGIKFDDHADLRMLMAGLQDDLAAEQEKKGENDFDVPGMGLNPHEHYDYLVVFASTTHEWNVICDKLALEPKARRGRMGIGRAIRAETLLKVLDA